MPRPRRPIAGPAATALLMALTLAAPARGADLSLTVVDAKGAPVADAVVALYPAEGEPPAPAAGAPVTVDQVDEAFVPLVQIVPKGGTVVFRNSDQTRHHVYSFSPTKPFEVVVTTGTSSEPIRFDTAGVVALGCNIHDPMVAWLYVTDTGWTARTGGDGVARLSGLPDGPVRAVIWHPRQRPGRPTPSLSLAPGSAAAGQTVTLDLLPDRRADPERSSY